MRGILIALLVVGFVAVVAPATATAHEAWCNFGDMTCWAKCQVNHVKNYLGEDHACRWAIGPPP